MVINIQFSYVEFFCHYAEIFPIPWMFLLWQIMQQPIKACDYSQTSNIRNILANKIVGHSDVVSTAPTSSSFST